LAAIPIAISIVVAVAIVVNVSIDVIVVVNVHVPTTRPAAAVVPVTTVIQPRAHSHSGTESDGASGQGCARIISWRRRIIIARIRDRIARVNHRWIVLRNIDNLRIGGLNLHDLVGDVRGLLFDGIGDDRIGDGNDLLGCGFESAGVLGFGSHCLDGIHQIFRLVDECIAQVTGPGNVIVHLRNHVGKPGDRFDVIVPRLLINLGDVVRVF
jgi:hypothetical protein